MTENEAVEILKNNYPKTCKMVNGRYQGGFDNTECNFGQALTMAIKALKEIQQFREIGTVEEFRKTADRNNQKQPVWKNGRSTIFKDYVDGHGEAEENKWADWVCPECGWFVGEQYLPRQHNQSKCNFCPKCGQAIRWEN